MAEGVLMATYSVGDKVKVFDVNGRSYGMPEGGWDGKVIKVGSKLITIAYEGNERVFRLDTRQANDEYRHQSFMRPAEARHSTALSVITSRGFELASWARHDINYLEAVAEALRNLPKPRL